MRRLQNAKLIARFLLVWFALSIGVAIASPIVNSQGTQLVCSGAGVKMVVSTGDEGTAFTGHTLDCPLCANMSAPPPLEIGADSKAAPLPFGIPVGHFGPITFVSAAPPPARGPPVLS